MSSLHKICLAGVFLHTFAVFPSKIALLLRFTRLFMCDFQNIYRRELIHFGIDNIFLILRYSFLFIGSWLFLFDRSEFSRRRHFLAFVGFVHVERVFVTNELGVEGKLWTFVLNSEHNRLSSLHTFRMYSSFIFVLTFDFYMQSNDFNSVGPVKITSSLIHIFLN